MVVDGTFLFEKNFSKVVPLRYAREARDKFWWMVVDGTFQSVGGWNFYRTPRKFAVWWMVVETYTKNIVWWIVGG